MVKVRTQDVALHAAANVLISALEQKHPYTKGHSIWVEKLTVLLASAMRKKWSPKQLEYLGIGARLHDIGKLCVEAATLNFQGQTLSPEQIHEVENHTIDGWQILRKSGVIFPDIIRDAILYHHEWWNGNHDGDLKGYPFGFTGKSIPLPSRLVAIADTFNALITQRSYQHSFKITEATKLLQSMAGKKLDPALTKIFLQKVIPRL